VLDVQTDDYSLDFILLYGRFKIQLMLTVIIMINPIDLFAVLKFIWHLCAPLDIFPYNVEQFLGSFIMLVVTKDCMSRKNNPQREVGLGQKTDLPYKHVKTFWRIAQTMYILPISPSPILRFFWNQEFKIIYNNIKKPFNERADCTHGTVVCCLLYPHCNGTWIELASLKFKVAEEFVRSVKLLTVRK